MTKIAITLGDPRGIGPEIVAAALADPEIAGAASFTVVGPSGTAAPVDEPIGTWLADGDIASAGRFAGLAIETATRMALAGEADGIVTAPIDKAALLAGGYDYPGHTEMLAALTGRDVAMMLASDRLRVVLATTHIPLREVPEALTQEAIISAAFITRRGLQEWFDIEEPRIALCAMNPHAGDGGRFGREDDLLLRPAANAADILGPLPADTVFVRAMRGEFDAVIAPYHDVGMTAINVASFGSALNVTLGLPFVRTSPYHGTAIDIAGKGLADPGSMKAAIRLAIQVAARSHSGLSRDSQE